MATNIARKSKPRAAAKTAPKQITPKQIPARKTQTRDEQFLALLRRKCMHAASIGALTAAAESVPGLGRVMRLVFGELLDATFLARVQRELIEETLALYEVHLPDVIKNPLVEKVQLLGTGASVGGDAFLRGMLKRGLGRVGNVLASRALPLLPIVTSASTNAAVTYAIGKRAQAVAKWRDAPLKSMPDMMRAFTGVDERRIYEWSLAAVKDAVGASGKFVGRIAAWRPKPKTSDSVRAKRAPAKRGRRASKA